MSDILQSKNSRAQLIVFLFWKSLWPAKGDLEYKRDKLLQCFSSLVTLRKPVKEEICFQRFLVSRFNSLLGFSSSAPCIVNFSSLSPCPWQDLPVFCFPEGKRMSSRHSPQCLKQHTQGCAMIISPMKCKLFFFLFLFIHLFIYGCVGSSFLCEGFL